jgi:hypothetical protein
MEINQNISSSIELSDNTIIWRYLTLEKFFSLLINKELYFSKISRLDDKYEGSRPPKYRFMNSIAFLGGFSPKYSKSKQLYEQNRLEMLQLQTDAYNTLVNCWTMEIAESYALWDIYAGSNSGIAIKSTIGQLKKAIINNNYLINIKEVDYHSIENGKFDLHRLVSWKTKFYIFEKEVRLYITHSGVDSLNLPIDTEELISEIYLSPFMPPYFGDIFKKLIKSNPSTNQFYNKIKDSAIKSRSRL